MNCVLQEKLKTKYSQNMAGRLFSPLINRFRRRGMNGSERLLENDTCTEIPLGNLSTNLSILPQRDHTSTTSNVNSTENNYAAVLGDQHLEDTRVSNENTATTSSTMTVQFTHLLSPRRKIFHLLGVTLTIFSTLLLSVSSLLIKLAESIPTLQIGFTRLTLQLVFSLPAMIFFKDQFIHPWKKTRFLILRGLTGATAMNMMIYSVKHMPLADARVIFLTSPVYTMLLGRIFLKESVSKFDFIATLLGLGGVVLIGRPSFLFGSLGKSFASNNIWLPTVLAVLSAIFFSFAIILVRKMSQEVSTRVVVFYFALVGSVSSLLVSLISGEFKYPDCGTHDVVYVIISGTLSYFAQLLSTKACQLEKASVVTLVRTTGIAFSFILQLIFLNVIPNGLSIGGAILILLCNVVIFIKKLLNHKKEQN